VAGNLVTTAHSTGQLYYGCNKNTCPLNASDTGRFWRVTEAAQPSKMLLVTDVDKGKFDAYAANQNNLSYPVSRRHADGTNVLWVDLHVSAEPTLLVDQSTQFWTYPAP
jgi:prepilin-type processing-associated H-X9-DG protein